MASIAEIMIQVLRDRHEELMKMKSNAVTHYELTVHIIRLWELEHIIEKIEVAIQTHEDFNTN